MTTTQQNMRELWLDEFKLNGQIVKKIDFKTKFG